MEKRPYVISYEREKADYEREMYQYYQNKTSKQ